MSATTTSETAIDPGRMYPLDAAKQITGFGTAALRSARRNGLQVRYVSNRGFIYGEDLISYIRQNGKAEHGSRPPDDSEDEPEDPDDEDHEDDDPEDPENLRTASRMLLARPPPCLKGDCQAEKGCQLAANKPAPSVRRKRTSSRGKIDDRKSGRARQLEPFPAK